MGEPDKHVRSGSTFELVCVLRDSTEPPVYVFWYHNDRMINYDNERGVVVSSDVEKSILTIQEAQKSDSGNYTCQPVRFTFILLCPNNINLFMFRRLLAQKYCNSLFFFSMQSNASPSWIVVHILNGKSFGQLARLFRASTYPEVGTWNRTHVEGVNLS